MHQITFKNILRKGYNDKEYKYVILDDDGVLLNIYIAITEVHGFKQKDIYDYLLSHMLTIHIDIVREMLDKIQTDDESEYKRFIRAIPVATEERDYYTKLFTLYMLECFSQWFERQYACGMCHCAESDQGHYHEMSGNRRKPIQHR